MLTLTWILFITIGTSLAYILGALLVKYNNKSDDVVIIFLVIFAISMMTLIFTWVPSDQAKYHFFATKLSNNIQNVQTGDLIRHNGGIYLVNKITPSAFVLTSGESLLELPLLEITSKDIWLANIDLPARKEAETQALK